MFAEPQNEHRWLEALLGTWTSEAECAMGPDQQPSKTRGRETVRSLGGLWIVAEGKGEMPGGGEAIMLLTLGYDPARQRFIGSWIGSMMTHMWVYEGTLDASGKVLTLDTTGPDFEKGSGTRRYQDIITLNEDGSRTLASRILGENGEWQHIMRADYRRA